MENKDLEVIKIDLDYKKCLEVVKKQPNCCLAPRVNAIDNIEKELKAKNNLVSMCENLAKLVGLKEKDYVELETLITKKLKALENISKAYGNYANYKISDYELIMIVVENTTY